MGTNSRVEAASERATDDAAQSAPAEADGRARNVHVAIGDPQAPLAKLLAILDDRGLLAESGRLRPEVALVSIGDHFDYGEAARAGEAERNGRLLLSWLAAHPADQVTLIAGNHDLARVGELASFDDAEFARARTEAEALATADDEGERRFLERYPTLPSSETARRDFNGFSVAQRTLVQRLLRERRLGCAVAPNPRLLLCHAGISDTDLLLAGAAPGAMTDAVAIAGFLNERFESEVATWSGREPLTIAGLHTPGSAKSGEGGGIFYHRPCHPARAARDAFSGAQRRRFDPRGLPQRVVQVLGHVRDDKCRELLGPWAIGRAARNGELRHLLSDGENVRYQASLPASFADVATAIFIDGGMNWTEPETYALLDLSTLAPYVR